MKTKIANLFSNTCSTLET